MIALALLLWFGFMEGAQLAWWMFVLAAMFDLEMADTLFGSEE